MEEPDRRQKKWVTAAADEVGRTQPAKSIELEHQSADKLKAIGVKIVTDVDKSGFIKIAAPLPGQAGQGLGPHAVKIKDLIGAVK